jgi:hypothetical protein
MFLPPEPKSKPICLKGGNHDYIEAVHHADNVADSSCGERLLQ